MVNMGELFAFDRIANVPMEKVPLSASEADRFLLEVGDLLFARASLKLSGAGKVSIILPASFPRTFESHIIRVRLDCFRAVPSFYYHFFRSSLGREVMYSIVEQVSAAGIRASDLATLPVPVPPFHTQAAVAALLDSLDDKIDLNCRMNQTLEAMASAIFKSWFIDFEPVKAKSAGAKNFPSMPQPVFDALPSSLVPAPNSPSGEIPKGWSVVMLPELIDVNPTRSLSKGATAPYLDMSNMPTQSHAPDAWVMREVGSGMRFRNGDTLVARITPCLENGKTAFVDFLNDGEIGWGSTEYIVLRPKAPLPLAFGYCLARSEGFREFAIQRMTGSSGRQRVPAETLRQLALPQPDDATAQSFGEMIDPLFALAKANMDESRTLASLRDVLLPKLLSGEVRVSSHHAEVSA